MHHRRSWSAGRSGRVPALAPALLVAVLVAAALAAAAPSGAAGAEGATDAEGAAGPTGAPVGPPPSGEPKTHREEFARAERPRDFEFPRDHGAHPAFRTEWWYLTGALTSPEGELYGVQATWFRNALAPAPPERESALGVRDLILFHAGWTDVGAQSFASASRIGRAASTWAGAREGDLDVWLLGDRLRREDDGTWSAAFEIDSRRIELRLTPVGPPLLHGESPGWSRKGPDPAESSYYVSVPHLEAEGSLQLLPDGATTPLRGQLWFDHEVFSQQLAADQTGWDWFSVALDDGTDLMAFHLRQEDGSPAPASSGTVRRPDGSQRHLARDDITLEVTSTWSSPAAAAGDPPYPAGWRLAIPTEGIELRIEPLVADQEHRSEDGDGTVYWEGLCRFTGARQGQPVEGMGYVELVGYRAERPRGM